MAADTKCGAVWVTVDAKHNGVMVTLDSLREQLAAQGLHVVTAAEKAVLDASAALPDVDVSTTAHDAPDEYWRDFGAAELARREAAK